MAKCQLPYQMIFDLLPEVEKEYRVLDLGCGNGILPLQQQGNEKAFKISLVRKQRTASHSL
jgi:tRNA1(Val) A37 N6-methylase TrmN6